MAAIYQFLPYPGLYQILVLIKTQHLAYIRIAVQKEPYELIKAIDNRVGLIVFILLKLRQSQQI